jgi:hypothetical protein
MRYKKLSIFGAGWYGLTPKIETLVSAAYVSRHEKLIFKNKKNLEPRSQPVRPRSEPDVIKLPLVDAAASHHRGIGHRGGRRHAMEAVAAPGKPMPRPLAAHRGSCRRVMEVVVVPSSSSSTSSTRPLHPRSPQTPSICSTHRTRPPRCTASAWPPP